MAPNLPKTYKVAMFKEANKPLSFVELDLKPPPEGQVLIKVLAVGVCHSDALVQAGVMNTFPRIPGHEIIGEVVALGPGEKKWKEGDRVGGAWHGGHDGTCKACNRGQYQMCKNEQINGVSRDGGYGEYAYLRSEATARVPSSIDPAKYSPLLCAGVTVFAGIRQLRIAPGETVAVQGLGGLGHLAVQYASKMGYRVVVLSSSAKKEKFARECGANDYIDGSKQDHADALQKMGGAALIVATSPDTKSMSKLIGGLDTAGKLLVLGVGGEVSVPSVPLIAKGLSVHGWPSGHALDCEEAINFALLHNIEVEVTTYPFAKAQEAFDAMLSGSVHGRAVLVM